MKENRKRLLGLGIVFIAAFAIWTVLIQIVDVQPLGQNGTKIVCCMLFGVIGIIQWIKRRSLWKVDRDIICLGIYYIIVIVGYLIFEIIPINYRPILIEGFLEASYPSSTTLLVLSVMPTVMEQMNRRLENTAVKKALSVMIICFSVYMVLGRLISGVHWFTDIVGSMLLSTGFVCIYKAVVLLCYKEEK